MKKITLALLVLLLFQNGFTQTIIFTEKFETCEGTYTEFGAYSDGASDYFIRTNGVTEAVDCVTQSPITTGQLAYTNTDGYYYTGEDVDRPAENPNTTGEFGSQALNSGVHFANIDVSTYDSVQISCSLAAAESSAFENGDYIRIYIDKNNTGSWELIGAAESVGGAGNVSLSIDTDLDGDGDGTLLSAAFQNFTFNVPSGATIMNARIEVLSSGSSEEIAFDSFEVKGENTLSSEIIESDSEQFELYPNPFDDVTIIKNNKQGKAFIYDSLGRLIFTQEIDKNNSSIDLTEQKSGIYLAKIILSNGNSKTLKLVKK